MKVKLLPLNVPLPHINIPVTRQEAQLAIEKTALPIEGWTWKTNPELAEFGVEDRDKALEYKCVALTVEDDGVYGVLEFVCNDSRLVTHQDEYQFYGRLVSLNQNPGEFFVHNGSLSMFAFSSVGHFRK